MSPRRQSQFLLAAYEVLSKAGRSMHYTQITSVALRLGILQSPGHNLEISMSSLLSEDIRANPNSRFVKERPGIYALSTHQSAGQSDSKVKRPDLRTPLGPLHDRTGLPHPTGLINKALYLMGRTLDIAGSQGFSVYRNFERNQYIEIRVPDLVNEFVKQNDQLAMAWVGSLSPAALQRSQQIACRLCVQDPRLAVQMSLFLLDLATDLVEHGNLLVIESSTSSIKLAVKSGRGYAG